MPEAILYPSFTRDLMAGRIALETDRLGVLLVTSEYQFSADHRRRADIFGEVVADGYTQTGQWLTGQAVETRDGRDYLMGNSLEWVGTITARGAVLYKGHSEGPDHDELICFFDLGRDVSSTNAPWRLTWDERGVLALGRRAA